jgi:hypothetical protein
MNDDAHAADGDALLDTFAAELTHAAYHVALRHGAAAGAWLELELELWQALTDTVKQWGRDSSPVVLTVPARRSSR